MSLINKDAELLNKILANRSKWYVKKYVEHDQMRFIPGCKVGSIFEKQLM